MEVHNEGWFICENHCGKKFKTENQFLSHVQRVKGTMLKKNKQIYQSEFEDETLTKRLKFQDSIGSEFTNLQVRGIIKCESPVFM